MFTAALLAILSPPTFAFVHFNVLPMTRNVVLRDQTVIVRDGIILSVGKSSRVGPMPGAVMIDGHRRLYLLPGLTDMHTHLRYENDLALYLANGVTTVRNMRGTAKHLDWRKRVQDCSLDGPRIYTAGPILGLYPGHVRLETPEAADKEVRKQKAEGYDFIKVYDELPGKVFKQVIKTAKQVGIPVVGHINRDLGVEGVLDAHQCSLEHAEEFAYRFFHDYDQTKMPALMGRIPYMARRTKEANSWVCPTMAYIADLGQVSRDSSPLLSRPEVAFLHPETYVFWTTERKPPEAFEEDRLLDAFQDKLVREFDRQGVKLLVGTDSYMIGSVMGFAVHREMKRMVLAGLSPYNVLKAATANAGQFTHGNFGIVKSGKVADLLVVSGNPLRNLAALDHIEGVMNRGRWHSRADLDGMLAVVSGQYAKGLRFAKLVLGGRTPEALTDYASWQIAGKTPLFDQKRIFTYLADVLKDQKRNGEAAEVAKLK